MTVFEALYDSEINLSIASFFDGGYRVKLGDKMNGFRVETTWPRQGATE